MKFLSAIWKAWWPVFFLAGIFSGIIYAASRGIIEFLLVFILIEIISLHYDR